MVARVIVGDCREVLPTLVPRTCAWCRADFAVARSRLKYGRGLHCSPACQYAAQRGRGVATVTLTCVGCGTPYPRPRSRERRSRYCTRPCRDRSRTGTLHPQYLGSDRPNYRGPDWQAQRRAARRRDQGTCRHCGATGTDVHHVVPFRRFEDYREANRLANLVTLCKPCHRRADAAVQAA